MGDTAAGHSWPSIGGEYYTPTLRSALWHERERSERERELITEHYKQESENLKTELKEPQQKAQEAFASVERLTSASSLTR